MTEIHEGYRTVQQMADLLGAEESRVRAVAQRLGLGFLVGRTLVLNIEDDYAISIGLKVLRKPQRRAARIVQPTAEVTP